MTVGKCSTTIGTIGGTDAHLLILVTTGGADALAVVEGVTIGDAENTLESDKYGLSIVGLRFGEGKSAVGLLLGVGVGVGVGVSNAGCRTRRRFRRNVRDRGSGLPSEVLSGLLRTNPALAASRRCSGSFLSCVGIISNYNAQRFI